jgi:hypothetical protein
MIKVTKHRVKKTIREKGTWKGLIVPSNMSPCSPWYCHNNIELNAENIDTILNGMMFYMHPEEGRYIHFYEK